MDGECHFCHGIVSAEEAGHIRLADHADHEVFVHRTCAGGHGLLEEDHGSEGSAIDVECPVCGAVETL